MSEAPVTQPGRASLRVLAQYIKDLSFENPESQHAIRQEAAPKIELSIHVHAEGRKEPVNTAEVSLTINAKAKNEKRTVFVIELTYNGIFEIINKKESESILLVEAPRILFPFARHIIADTTREGGFPPLMIDPIDFSSLYKTHKKKDPGITSVMTSTTAH